MACSPARGLAAHASDARAISQADWLWFAVSLARLHRVAADPALLANEYPPPHDLASLERALRALGLRTRHRRGRAGRGLRTPCIAWLRREPEPGERGGAPAVPPAAEAGPGDAPGEPIPVLVVKTDGERLLYFRAGSQLAQTAREGEGGIAFEPEVLGVEAPERAPGGEGAGLAPQAHARGFGLRWFAAELARHAPVLRDVLLAGAGVQLAGLLLPLFTQVVIDKVVAHHSLSTLAVVSAGMAIVIGFGAVMNWLRQYLLIHTGNRVDAVLSAQVLRRMLRLPLAYFDHRATGTLIARLQAVETIREFLCGALLALVLELPFMAVFLAVMLLYSVQLSLISVALIVALAVLSLAITARLRSRLNRQFLLGARAQALVTEHVAAMETVKSLQMEPRIEARFGEYLAAYLGASYRTRVLANTYNVTAGTLEQAQTAAILAAGALLVIGQPGFTVGMLVAFQMFAARLSQPVLRLVGLYQQFQQASVAVSRLADIMDAPEEPHALGAARCRTRSPAAIDIRGLGFRYGPERPWLFRHLDLAVPPGHALALMGTSGCGKSTLARLLQGMYVAEEGSIRLDGIDIRHLPANELRSHFGVVPQETVLFSGSVLDNLLAADPDAGFEDVVRACQAAGIHEAIERLPQGYQSELGERGTGLSGGQKQRLAIARALLKRARVLIFDEATASLDATTAGQLAQTINQLKGQVTMLIIAHQLPPGLEVDEVVRMGQ